MSRNAGCIVASTALLMWLSVPVLPAAPQRDNVGTTVTGTGRIAGAVLAADASSPRVRRAIVTLSGSNFSFSRDVLTNDAGEFVFTDVPSGRFTLAASWPGEVTIPYGATRPDRRGTSLVVAAGQQIADVRVYLLSGAVITGVVLDANGESVPGVDVRVERVGRTGVLPVPHVPARTDDRGVYRIFGLAPGSYIVSTWPDASVAGDVRPLSDADVDAAFARLQEQSRRSSAPGVSLPLASARPVLARTHRIGPIYYPSAVSPEDAVSITLAAGETREGADISTRLVSTSVVEGTVALSGGMPTTSVQLNMMVSATGMPTGANPTRWPSSLRPNADGTFRYASVPPGHYVLSARALPPDSVRVGVGMMSMADYLKVPRSCEFATADLTIAGNDVSGVSLALRPCPRIAGRVVFSGTMLSPPADLAAVSVSMLRHVNNGLAPVRSPGLGAFQNAEGAFQFGAFGELPPAAYSFSAHVPGGVPGRGWWLRSVVVDGRDVTDDPLVLGADSPDTSNAVVTFSDRHTSLTGVLQTSSGEPAVDYTVIAFTANRRWWAQPFRRVVVTRPGNDGTYLFTDLPPGDYFLAALTDVGQDEWRDAEFLERLVPSSLPIAIADGEEKLQDIRLTGR